jgi:hypothetical protein
MERPEGVKAFQHGVVKSEASQLAGGHFGGVFLVSPVVLVMISCT